MRCPGYENVLMVSHGAACAQFPRALGVELTEKLGRRIGNCGIFIYEFDGDSGFELLDAINPNE